MITPILYKDFYKTDHRRQYPKGTEMVYSNLTARTSRLEGLDHVVVFGVQYFIKEFLIKRFNDDFFNKDVEEVVSCYKRRMDTSLGEGAVPVDHIRDLHELGYLPLEIKCLPEGSLCPIKTPILTIKNTHPKFFWLTNFLETLVSNVVWHPMTSATISYKYREILDSFARETNSDMLDFVQFQGHDFSMRGHSSLESSMSSGAAHLLSFVGSDTIPAIDFLEIYYNANSEKELIGCSVPATEHSVMCMGGAESEAATFQRLITELYPSGIVSIVSDTWDYWEVVTEVIPSIKEKIMSRDGKLVVRPDSGDPVKIICGDPEAKEGSPEQKGTVQCLWDTFGGEVSKQGFKQLDSHIGVIYGDSITIDRCIDICQGLKNKGFASTNIVYGIGSYTYQYVTRDTFGFAVKSTYGVVNGHPFEIYKDPKTDDGVKKSARGLLKVNPDFTFCERVSEKDEKGGALEVVFRDGNLLTEHSLSEIRERLLGNLCQKK